LRLTVKVKHDIEIHVRDSTCDFESVSNSVNSSNQSRAVSPDLKRKSVDRERMTKKYTVNKHSILCDVYDICWIKGSVSCKTDLLVFLVL
jgi:hypothetical protein